MAVIVEITQLNAPNDTPPGQKSSGSMQIALNGDYEAPLPFQAQIFYQFTDADGRGQAIEQAMKAVVELAEQIRLGAEQAAAQHPAGG